MAQPTALSDWALPAGRRQEAAALITAGDELLGSLDAGELTLDNADITINRIQVFSSGATFIMYRTGSGSWSSILEGSRPPYADVQIHIQYGDQAGEIVVLNINNLHANTSSSFARFNVPSTYRSALDGIANGDTFILAVTRAVPNADAPAVTIDAVAVGVGGTKEQLAATLVGGSYDALDYAWTVGSGALDDATSATPTWTRPDVTSAADIDVDLTITARGTGLDVVDGTSEAAKAVTFIARVTAPPYVAYNKGLTVAIGDAATKPLTGSLKLSRSLADGSTVDFTVRGTRANLTHIQRGAKVTVTDVASSVVLFSGHVLTAVVRSLQGDGTLVNIAVNGSGIEQHVFRALLTAANARDVNSAATATDQLAHLVTIMGSPYSSGAVHPNANKLAGAASSVSVGQMLRLLGDAQLVKPTGEIEIIMRDGLGTVVNIDRESIRPSSDYDVSLDTTVGRVLALGADVQFIATGLLSRVTKDGVVRVVATITPPANTEIIRIGRVVARQALIGKFATADNLDGIWDPDKNRFEWSGTLNVGQTALVEMHGTWRTEIVVSATAPSSLARDIVLNVPSTGATAIATAAKRALLQARDPIELLRLDLVLGASLPLIVPGDAVTVALALQEELDIYQPIATDKWLVYALELSQPGSTQAAVSLELSRRLPDTRNRDFWSDDSMATGSEGRQIVIGSGGGAPQIAQVIPSQVLSTASGAKVLSLGDFFSDPDGDTLSYSAVSSVPAKITVTVSGSNLTITPVAVGSVTITVTASDASRSAAQLFSVSVNNNRAPVSDARIPVQRGIPRRSSGKVLSLGDFFSDPDGDTLSYSAVSSVPAVIVPTIISGGTRLKLRRLTPGSATITVTATDGIASIMQTFGAQNGRPTNSGGVDTLGDKSLNLAGRFSDPDGDTLTYSAVLVRAPVDEDGHGPLIRVTGSRVRWSYQANLDEEVEGEFVEIRITARDPNGATSSLLWRSEID